MAWQPWDIIDMMEEAGPTMPNESPTEGTQAMTHMSTPPPANVLLPPHRPSRMSSLVKVLIIFGIVLVLSFTALTATCLYFVAQGPDTKVLPGRQVPARFVSQIRSLGVLEADEQIEYFYSDALFDIEDGFYLLTDRKVVVYSCDYEVPAVIVPLSEIADLSVTYDNSFFTDSLIRIISSDETAVTFPVSSEGGGDKTFYMALHKKWKALGSNP